MAKRFNVGVDVDGVLSNFTLAARTLCKELFNGKPSDALVQTGWGFDSIGLTKEEEEKMWRVIDRTPNWWLHHAPMSFTDFLPQLCTAHRVIFITNRKDGTGYPIEEQTAHWLKGYFDLWNPMVVISDNKGPLATGLKLDYFIDDRPKNVTEVMLYSPATETYIADGTYNQECNALYLRGQSVPVKRVKNFDEFARIVMEAA